MEQGRKEGPNVFRKITIHVGKRCTASPSRSSHLGKEVASLDVRSFGACVDGQLMDRGLEAAICTRTARLGNRGVIPELETATRGESPKACAY